MQKEDTSERNGSPHADEGSVPFASNEVRLSPRECVVALGLVAVLLCLVPILWRWFERFEPGPDYRIPYSLGNDYWIYGRYCRAVSSRDRTSVVGDSVVWGHYVTKEHALSSCLNRLAGEDRFANAGVDGIHPAAMAGLVEYYGRGISGGNVILHCNLLWLSSRKHDLQIEKEFSFNHPTLVPQFFPDIPCYTEPYSGRIAVVMGRKLPFHNWAGHLQVAYFGDTDCPTWTIEHPYDSPLGAVTLDLPSPDELPSPVPVAKPWTRKRMAKFNAHWVDLETSFQWRSFRRTIEVLQGRENRVFVLVGPFNEHMLTEESLEIYNGMKGEVEAWLEREKIPYYIPSALPSDCYADASHPLGDGYAMLAERLFGSESFVGFDERRRAVTPSTPSTPSTPRSKLGKCPPGGLGGLGDLGGSCFGEVGTGERRRRLRREGPDAHEENVGGGPFPGRRMREPGEGQAGA